jgi:hypothetical protein
MLDVAIRRLTTPASAPRFASSARSLPELAGRLIRYSVDRLKLPIAA